MNRNAPGNPHLLKPASKKAGKLSEKMVRFIAEFKIDQNAKNAAERAGYSGNCYSIGHALLIKPQVRAEIDKWLESIKEECTLEHKQITAELMKWAFTPISEFLEIVDDPITKSQTVQFKTSSALDKINASCVKSIKIGRRGIELTLKSPEQAMDMLARHVGYFAVDNSQKKEEGTVIYLPDNGRNDVKTEE